MDTRGVGKNPLKSKPLYFTRLSDDERGILKSELTWLSSRRIAAKVMSIIITRSDILIKPADEGVSVNFDRKNNIQNMLYHPIKDVFTMIGVKISLYVTIFNF